MIANTHILMANIIYKYILKSTNFMLDLPSFSYGNIKPDLDKNYIKCEHTLEDSIKVINIYSEDIIDSDISVKDFSMALGVICHFVCDYFCLCHTKEYWKKDKVGHGLYELTLHTRLLSMFLTKSINVQYKCKIEKNVEELILKIRKKYGKEPQGVLTDINYALIAAASTCELIIKSSKLYNNRLLR